MNKVAVDEEPLELRHDEPRRAPHHDLRMRDEADRADDHRIAGSRAPAALREDEERDGGRLVQAERGAKDRNDRVLR